MQSTGFASLLVFQLALYDLLSLNRRGLDDDINNTGMGWNEEQVTA